MGGHLKYPKLVTYAVNIIGSPIGAISTMQWDWRIASEKRKRSYLQPISPKKWFNPFSEKEVGIQLGCILASLGTLADSSEVDR